MQTVTLSNGKHSGVRLLTLNDPGQRNAIGTVMQRELTAAVAEVAGDPEARVLVVTGAGSAFCSGAHLTEVLGGPVRTVAEARRDLQAIYRSFLGIRELELLTIAAVHGPAIGAGLNLAMACDLRIAGPQARLGATFSRIGLHPGGGCTYFLVRALGPQRALKLLLDGDTLDARQALDLGLVLEIEEDPLAAALSAAGRYADLGPELLRDIKQSVRIADSAGLEASVQFEAWAQASSTTDARVRAALTATNRPSAPAS